MEKDEVMKKIESEQDDELRSEYDFASMQNGVRGKYVERYHEGSNIVMLDPEGTEESPNVKTSTKFNLKARIVVIVKH
jgi:hypothetical protein